MRPYYHYAAAANWLSDPNGLVHAHGEWHMFYQYNPHGEDWGHMSWGHAVSTDLRTWQELPVALADDDQNMIFSGSAVVDTAGTAGFGKGALVALYTLSAAKGPPHQSQAIASSTDNGRTWTKYPGNPVLDLGLADFRDPNVFWHEATARWIMVVALSEQNRALILASHDLKQWDELSVIHGLGAPGRVWECPLLLELPVDGGSDTRWLFKIDVLHDGPGSGAIYQSGTFDGVRFVPDGPANDPWWQVADHGRDFYAAIAWHEPRDAAGRPLWIGWIGNHAYQARLPRQGWRGAMSLPRRLSFVASGDRWLLRQEVEQASVTGVPTLSLESAAIGPAGRIELPATNDFVLSIGDGDGRKLAVELRGDQLLVARHDPVSPFLDASSPMKVKPGAPVEIWLDGGSCELIGDNGSANLTMQHRLTGTTFQVDFEAAAELER